MAHIDSKYGTYWSVYLVRKFILLSLYSLEELAWHCDTRRAVLTVCGVLVVKIRFIIFMRSRWSEFCYLWLYSVISLYCILYILWLAMIDLFYGWITCGDEEEFLNLIF